MSDNRLNTRILLRYDKYSRLMTSDVILQPGEMAVAAFPDTDPSLPPRAFGVKVGDGTRYFDELPWIQAIAADVYEWAKDPTKPVYQATEIQGLAEYIQNISGGGGGGSASSGSYRIIYDNASNKYILQQWDEANDEWASTSSEIDFSGVLNRLDTIERWANGALTKLGVIEMPLTAYVYEEVMTELNKLDVFDEPVIGQYVTAVSQLDGEISVTRESLNMSNVTQGILPSEHGGTGLARVNEDQVLIGSIEGSITTKNFVTTIEEDSNTDTFATTAAIIRYVLQKTAGLTGAMHYIGESTVPIDSPTNSRVNPLIPNYNFSNAQPGDVIIANGTQEYVWTGSNWHLLGDEGSYAVKGSIKNADIADDAGIAQSKIDGLQTALEGKVDKEEGKSLMTAAEKEKLSEIESGAQVNLIEHIIVNDNEVTPNAEKSVVLTIPVLTQEQLDAIDAAQENVIEHVFVNGEPLTPTTIQNLPKSVNVEFIPYTQEEKDKLNEIEAGAEVNAVESIIVNGTTYEPENKQISITIDQAALDLNVLEGARYPQGNGYESIEVTNKKLELSKVAATGNIDDLIQTADTFIILDCGTSDSTKHNSP